MKKLLSLLLVFIFIQLSGQSFDTLMLRYHTDGTLDTLSISKIDSITFRYDTVLVNYRLSGKVFDSLNNIVDSGNVFLLLINQASKADTIQVATLDAYGAYEFDQVDPGLYLLRAEVSAASLNAVTTYYPNNFLWGKAQTLNLVQDTLDMDIHIIQLGTPSSTGSGMISGCLVEGSSFRGPGEPIDSIVIGLIRPNVSNDIYMLDETDSAGCFSFKNLADGDYALYPDIAGIPLDTAVWSNINISGSDTETVQLIADSNMISFSIHSPPIDIEGYTYETVVIGAQEWFAENLRTTKYRDGNLINYGSDTLAWQNDSIGSYVWYTNDSSMYDSIYGKLYNWYAVDNSSGLCPVGWHVPTNAEFLILMNYLGGSNDAGGKMKESGLAHWNAPNTGADNSSGFTALPGGYRVPNGNYKDHGDDGDFWSATESNLSEGLFIYLNTGLKSFGNGPYSKKYGFSVRCLRD